MGAPKRKRDSDGDNASAIQRPMGQGLPAPLCLRAANSITGKVPCTAIGDRILVMA